MEIKMAKTVRPDLIFLSEPWMILRAGEVYEAKKNKWGAVMVVRENGKIVGVKPEEFEIVKND